MFCTPQVTQFSEGPNPPFNKGGGGVLTMMNPNDVMVVVVKDIVLFVLYLLGFRFIYRVNKS